MMGNFGVRAIETMPTNIRDVFIPQVCNVDLGAVYDQRLSKIPAIYDKPDKNDYLTDEESDDAQDFEVKVPDLDELLATFENDDDIIL